jgi:tRNA pseudouridine38-40 synthase
MRAFRIAYDGRPYHGFQRQPSVSTVEDAILDALDVLGVHDTAGDDAEGGASATPPGYAAAGRTDAGVSALAQTIAFEAPEWLAPRALNAELPASVRAWASADVSSEFHATHDATSRTYDYYWYAPTVDVDRAASALAVLEGTHDFSDLTARSRETDTVRTIDAATITQASTSPEPPSIEAPSTDVPSTDTPPPDAPSTGSRGEVYRIRVRADGFLWELVRRLVALVDEVARGTRGLDAVERTLAPEPLPDHERVGPAPAEGLVLGDVTYPDVDFDRDPTAGESASAVFESVHATAAARSCVARHLRDGVHDPPGE